MTPLRVGIAALAWVVLTAIAPVAESRLTTLRRTTKGKQPLKAFPLDGFTGRSLKDFAASSDNTTCAFLPDTSSHCNGAEHLCYVDDEMGEYIAQTCQTTCKICRVCAPSVQSILLFRPALLSRMIDSL